jgi:hypothetical protein
MRSTEKLLFAVVLCVAAVPGCRKKLNRSATAEKHRPVAAACDSAPGEGYTHPGSSGTCSKDSDCTKGRNGRCMAGRPRMGGRSEPNHCEYDDCFSDTECGAGETCNCGLREPIPERHRCLPSNCRIDGDCGPNGFCSPSKKALGAGTIEGWFCHTEDDECTNDGDCLPEKANSFPYCGYSKKKERWICDRAHASI